MKPWKRAWLYVSRERKRSIRLTLVFLVLTLLLLLCGWVQASMARNAQTLRETIGASFRIEDDEDGMLVSDALIRQIEDIGNIRRASGENLQILYSETIRPIPGMLAGGDDEGQYMMSYYSGHYSELEQHFRTGEFTLIEGRHIMPEDNWAALISKQAAQQNGLSVGDSFTAGFSPSLLTENPAFSAEPFRFTVTGIFEITQELQSIQQSEPAMPQNAVFIDATAGHAIDAGDPTHSRYRYGAIFQVADPRTLPQTVATVQDMLDMQHFHCVVDDTAYRQSVQPLERVELLMRLLTGGMTVVGTVVLALILLLWIRQRTHEIGVYLSVGISKRNILMQFLTESIVSAIAADIIAIPLSFAIPTGIRLTGMGSQMLPFPQTAGIFSSILLLLTAAVLATILASVRLFRLQPKDILLQP